MAHLVMQVLLNWLWQGMAIGALVGLLARAFSRRVSATTRERVWWIALVALAGMPVVHVLLALADAPGVSTETRPGDPAQGLVVAVPAAGTLLVGLAWTVWTALGVLRLGVAAVSLRQAKHAARPLPPGREATLPTWCALRRRGRQARLVVSNRVHRAAVLGLGRPAIALAPETLDSLSDLELDQIVVHEYAHVQRRDDWAIVLQRLIVAVAGLHPAVWWMSRALTTEREVACDDWVVAHTGSARRYATCLVGLASRSAPLWSLSPGAVLTRPQLAIRVARLLDRGRNQTIVQSRGVLLVAKPAMAALVALSATWPLIDVAREVEPIVDLPRLVMRSAPAEARLLPPEMTIAPARTAEPEAAPASRPDDPRAKDQSPRPEEVGDARPGPIETRPVTLPAPTVPRPPGTPVRAFELDTSLLPPGTLEPVSAVPQPQLAEGQAPSPWEPTWRPAAELGVAVAQGSRHAAVKTAGFFTRLGRSVAGGF